MHPRVLKEDTPCLKIDEHDFVVGVWFETSDWDNEKNFITENAIQAVFDVRCDN